jgi:hypothetical protein
VARNKETTITLSFGRGNRWVYKELVELVEAKEGLGQTTSIQFEIMRLLKAGIMGNKDEWLRRADAIGLFEKVTNTEGPTDEYE